MNHERFRRNWKRLCFSIPWLLTLATLFSAFVALIDPDAMEPATASFVMFFLSLVHLIWCARGKLHRLSLLFWPLGLWGLWHVNLEQEEAGFRIFFPCYVGSLLTLGYYFALTSPKDPLRRDLSRRLKRLSKIDAIIVPIGLFLIPVVWLPVLAYVVWRRRKGHS